MEALSAKNTKTKESNTAPKPMPIPALNSRPSMLAGSTNGRTTEVNIPNSWGISNALKPNHIARQVVLIFGFSQNRLMVVFVIYVR